MKFNFFLIIIILCFSSSDMMGQKKKKRKNDVQIIEFEDDDVDIRSGKKRGKVLIIKTSPFSYILGKQTVQIEKEINNYFSLQAAVGVTFKPFVNLNGIYAENDLVEINPCGESPLWGNADYCDDWYDNSIRKYSPGIYVSVTPTFYFDNFAPEDSYFGLRLGYSTLNIDVQRVEEGASNIIRLPNDYQEESVKRYDIIGHYGYQTLFTNLTASYFVGLGVRFEQHTRQDLGYDQNFNVYNGVSDFSTPRLRIEGGIRIGFQL